jgi:hypothetical protein
MTEIYAIVHPETGKYVYIGKTGNTKKMRMHMHKYCGSELSEWIRGLDKDPGIKTIATVEDDIANDVERKMIAKYCDDLIFNKAHNPNNKKFSHDVEFLSNLKEFFNQRPALSFAGICREAGITHQYLRMILNGERNMTESTKEKLLPVIKKYGY